MVDPSESFSERVSRRKACAVKIRDDARSLFQQGVSGNEIARSICAATDDMLLSLIDEVITSHDAELVAKQGAIVAVGGTGRGELAPYSDIDLLFLHERTNANEFLTFVSEFVQNCWDCKFQLGHSSRDITSCIQLAKQDPQIATSLIEARFLWGNETLYHNLVKRFKRYAVANTQFISNCLEARSTNWHENKPPQQELEPDIKSSSGGLRDLHLIRWVGFGRYGVRDIDAIQEKAGITESDAQKLKAAWEYLTTLRIDLHFEANKEQDLLTKDEQLRITEQRGIQPTDRQRAVEVFMQEYFHHSSELAAITRRFAAMERPRSLTSQTREMLMGHRAEGIYFVGPERIDVVPKNIPQVTESIESMLRIYKAAALYNVQIAPHILEAIKLAVPGMDATELSQAAGGLFLEILRCTKSLGPIVRSMFDTRLLDLIIPDVTHVRNLLQFNQYHHFTVDEHTLRAIDTVTSFEGEEGPVGAAYAATKRKETLHLALLLHDLGKGMGGDHSIIGEGIAQRVGKRLGMPDFQTDQVAVLVRQHLEMADLAFRRDITDAALIMNFTRNIGSPDTLRMLYVLTVADVTAVGPGTWTDWKGNLLTELYDRCHVMLSGKRYSYHEEKRLKEIKERVRILLARQGNARSAEWVDHQLQGFSAYYLSCTAEETIADDLRVIGELDDEHIDVLGTWDTDTNTVEYRVITKNPISTRSCFHKMVGVLTAKRHEILSADINTSNQGVIVDRFSVMDHDYTGAPPESRLREVSDVLKSVLRNETTVEELLLRNTKYGQDKQVDELSELPLQVKIDTGSSDTRTIIDVFAYDRRGLLYIVSRAIFDLGLSVDMAKIDTYFDQTLDVFYVQEQDGSKPTEDTRIHQIQSTIEQTIREFFNDGE